MLIYKFEHNQFVPNFGWDGDREFKTADWLAKEVFTPREFPLVFNPFFEGSELEFVVLLFWWWMLLEWCDVEDALLTADGVGLGFLFRSWKFKKVSSLGRMQIKRLIIQSVQKLILWLLPNVGLRNELMEEYHRLELRTRSTSDAIFLRSLSFYNQ